MPPQAHATAKQNFAMANCVHFGFEGDARSIIYKLYLERAVPELEARQARAAFEPVLQHLAFKWDVVKNVHVVTRYLWHPFLSEQQIEARLEEVYRQLAPSRSLEIAKAVMVLAAQRAPTERLQYLEVQEDENARWSFDLNLYGARLQVKAIQTQLQAMREHFRIRPGQFQALYDQIKNRPLGHVAGGVHRNGNDFFNVYYGVAGFPHFAERFG
jgi:tryptophan halogenase